MIARAMENSGGRRFILTMGAGITTSLLQYLGKLDPAGTTYAMVVIGTVGAFITNNTWRKTSTAKAVKE